jgi:acetyl-CoA C-acetyltransferase
MKNEVIIASACRTPIGNFGGSLSGVSAAKLGGIVIAESIKRAGIDPGTVDEVIFGCVLQAGLGQNIARQSSVMAGIPFKVPSTTLNMVCGSGLKTVCLAAQSLLTGEGEIIIAGGTENMSQSPYILREARWGARMGNLTMVDSLLNDALTDTFNQYHMGITAENIADKYLITRAEQDLFALSSQQKAEKSQAENRFREEIIPVQAELKKGESKLIENDEYIRYGTTIEKLAALKPAFNKNGTVTAGNSSGINDGAAALVIMSREKAQKLGIQPMAGILSYASSGVEPSLMGIGPVESCRKALQKAELSVDDIGLAEINEAFAAQAIAVVKELGIMPERLNVNGGAIALGHPVGASGARILVTLLYEMKRRNTRYGMAALCIGGGMGITVIVENESAEPALSKP